MKVACIGNMNNNFLSVTRYLRDRGIDANLLLLNNELPHFHPSVDSYDLGYREYTSTLRWGNPFHFSRSTKSEVLKDLSSYDFIIGCDTAPAFLTKIGRTLDIFMPFGGDLLLFPFFRMVNPKHQLEYIKFSRAQKTGIEKSRYLVMDYTNEDTEQVFTKLNFKGERLNRGIPMLYTPVYNPASISDYYDRTHWYREFEKVRRSYELVVFHHSRHSWKNSEDHWSWKSNDKLFKGFADFARVCNDVNACIVTFERGVDVPESKRLIRELGIEKLVHWFPQMGRKDLMVGLSQADIGSGEFESNGMSCGTVYETLAMAKPLMHCREDHLYESFYPELYPLMNVHSARDITEALLDYVARPDYYKEMGEKGRQWFQQYAIDEPVNEVVRIIKANA